MKKPLAIMILVTLTLSMYALAIPVSAASPSLPDYQSVDWRTGLAGSIATPGMTASDDQFQEIPDGETPPSVGTKAYDWYLRAITRTDPGGPYPWMTLRAISGNVEVWVADYLAFPAGDPRNDDPYNTMITDQMCQYLADEFNNVIYPVDTTYFGTPVDRDGSNTIFEQAGYPSYYWDWILTDNPQRVILKVLNIRDTNYYDPEYPYYTAGFFSPTYTMAYYNRNMIHIDCWKWWERLGPEGTQWFSEQPELLVDHPHTYDGVTAHEFQHNIHNDLQPDDDLFMNEGCSMYAEFLCGYGVSVNDINSYLATPDNSLTFWSDQGDINILADYGVAELWTIYLSDQYGGSDFISYYMRAGIPSIAGINNALAYFGYEVTFDDVYHDWRIANLIHTDYPGCGRYNYKSIDLGDPQFVQLRLYETFGLPVHWMSGSDFGTTVTILGYDTSVSEIQPYGSDYIKFQNWKKQGLIGFIGDKLAGWTYDGVEKFWWSGYSDLYDALLVASARVNPEKPYLTLETRYGIESYWDFGFVQVSTDNGETWTSLANEYTTLDHDPSAHPAIVPNLPGLTDYNPDWPEWTTMTFDLSAYAGQRVMIGFRYMTDWATTYEGWFIKRATVSDKPLKLTPVSPQVDWQVTLLYVFETCHGAVYVPWDMWLCHWTQSGFALASARSPNYVIMIVTPIMSSGWADYHFFATPFGWHCR